VTAVRLLARCYRAIVLAMTCAVCGACAGESLPLARATPAIGQWVWTRADVHRFTESAAVRPELEAAVFIGSVHCDTATNVLVARAGLSPRVLQASPVSAVIRFEDGLDRCRGARGAAMPFNALLDSAVSILLTRTGDAPLRVVQLDHDAPVRALPAWAATVRYLSRHALARDSVWVTSIIAHLREPAYGDLFRDVVRGHVLQVFDTGEAATAAQVSEAVRIVERARMPFRLGLGAFERETKRGVTEHRAWFETVPQFARTRGYAGLWVFPAGRRWITLLRDDA
jgi:hypothetical protein